MHLIHGMQSSFGTSVLVDAIGNPNLKWQKTLDKNVGVDISLLGNRLNLNMDYFIRIRILCGLYHRPFFRGYYFGGNKHGKSTYQRGERNLEIFTDISSVRSD